MQIRFENRRWRRDERKVHAEIRRRGEGGDLTTICTNVTKEGGTRLETFDRIYRMARIAERERFSHGDAEARRGAGGEELTTNCANGGEGFYRRVHRERSKRLGRRKWRGAVYSDLSFFFRLLRTPSEPLRGRMLHLSRLMPKTVTGVF